MRMQRGWDIRNDLGLNYSAQAHRNRRGFTLVEIMACIAIVAIMAISIIRARNQSDDAKVVSVANTARLLNDIACMVYETTGSWPADVSNSTLPPEMKPYLSNNVFDDDTPMNGRWDWNGPTTSVNNLIGIALRFNPTSTANHQLLVRLDELIDDGDLQTGSCQKIVKSGSLFYVMSVATK